MKTLQIKSNIHNYNVFFENDLNFINGLSKMQNAIFMIDENIFRLYKNNFAEIKEENLFLFEAIEENKTLESVMELYKFLATKDAKKNLTLISIGGGITQDVSGFVASTLYRGIQWIFIPTTFLAQADSCIGSKTSLNFEKYKNILGGFYPPHKIFVAPTFLNTLSKKDFFSGIGEVIKFALLKEEYPKDFSHIIKLISNIKNNNGLLQAIYETMDIKIKYINEDEFDTGKRNLFNYGHCFGHALESSSNYAIPHGIAVTIGMIYANIVSLHRNVLSQNIFDFLNQELFLPNIFIELKPSYFNETVLLDAMKNDKKRVGVGLTIITPVDDYIKASKIDDFTELEFLKALKKLKDILKI